MNINEVNYKDCMICGACNNICPTKCISNKEYHYGFYYPNAYEEECVDCGLCLKVCPIDNIIQKELRIPQKSLCVKNRDESVRKISSSGGLFHPIAKNVIDKNGVVYAAGYNEDFTVEMMRIDSLDKIDLVMRSKYMHMDVGNMYINIKSELEQETLVLFAGCPCHVKGLKSFLMKEYENLVTVDFICHGSASPMVFKDYLKLINSDQKTIEKINFREKTNGWNQFRFQITYSDNTKYSQVFYENWYMRGFLTNYYEKESCHNCSAKMLSSGSDIVLADFWMSEEKYPDFHDNLGTSALMLQSKKGIDIINEIKDNLDMFEVCVEDVIEGNRFMVESAPRNKNKEEFFLLYNSKGLKKAMKKYLGDSLKQKTKNTLKKILR